jgi:hypothetical protein
MYGTKHAPVYRTTKKIFSGYLSILFSGLFSANFSALLGILIS